MGEYVRLETVDGITVATWTDAKIVPEAKDALYALATAERLLLDLGSVGYLSSNGLAILTSFKKHIDAVGGRLRLCGLHADLVELLRITKLIRLFEVFDDRQNALQGF